MRYEKGHKEATRQKIIETAATEFRRNGIGGIGVADLMAQTGLTHGGFYSHFKSKEELVVAAMEEVSKKSRLRRMAEEGASLEDIIRWYLSPEHCSKPEKGCAAAALVGELGRYTPEARAAFTASMKRLNTLIHDKLPTEMPDRKKTATAIFSVMLGALQMARTVDDPEFSELILKSGTEAAINLTKI